MNTNEIWKNIPEYEGDYQVSNLGNIKSLKRDKERILKANKDGRGYYSISLCKIFNGIKTQKTKRIHILVAMVFLNHKPDGTNNIVVDHIDGNKENNNVDNLRLVSSRENTSNFRKDLEKLTSKYTGVHLNKRNGKWLSRIYYNNSRIYLGTFNTEIEASEAYQNKLKELIN